MNIFYLDRDYKQAAKMHNNKHVVKMILETAQLLSTAHRVLDGSCIIDTSNGRKIKRWKLDSEKEDFLYKATHINHPSAVWVRQSSENYLWTFNLFNALMIEYTYRYGKHHKCEFLRYHLIDLPKNILYDKFTEPPQAMPEYCKIPGDSVQAYRTYYILEKSSLAQYTRRPKPEWLVY